MTIILCHLTPSLFIFLKYREFKIRKSPTALGTIVKNTSRSIILLKLIQIHINRNPKPQLKPDQKNITLAGDTMHADSANERGDTDDTVDTDHSTTTDISGSDTKPSESDSDSSDCDDDDED